MTSIEISELEDRIKQLKKELVHIAETTDLNSSETIYYSQELDQLITIYQKLSYTNMLLNGNKIT
ncbi:hypothetical protein BAOM_2718 [Peribacillus asahii]|uniref:Aspartyl-phosphate phosphatase Spo0E family protein n=1 Tax=Peribacillus asahii TaxID=228899 RepID=A0A3T0KSF6_9BACI|nr:aspartyl-phosphate phosphatase Spo0E family protein [Peribacillus asahii]AZV43327.1 hypothetical protein BAOM_2718 [Peribacillus asahii]